MYAVIEECLRVMAIYHLMVDVYLNNLFIYLRHTMSGDIFVLRSRFFIPLSVHIAFARPCEIQDILPSCMPIMAASLLCLTMKPDIGWAQLHQILISACISNNIHYKVWDEIIHSFLNSANVEVWEWISNFIPHFTEYIITYACWDFS